MSGYGQGRKRAKKAATRPDKRGEKPFRCFRCDGTGQVCDTCGESEIACACAPASTRNSACEDCKGAGK